MTSLWYRAPAPDNLPSPSTAPQPTSFEEGLRILTEELTADGKKRALVSNLKPAKLEDLLGEVQNAQSKFESNHEDSKVRKCIVAFSKRVHYYGSILDVMVQHHPEYVALAWGAMKVVFGAILEREKLGLTIVNGMSDIADALPKVRLAEALYPTPTMQKTIATLYALIMRFLLRALDWYNQSTATRALQSITRPAALRYDDLIQEIEKTARKVDQLSVAGSQAEQRDMHHTLHKVQVQQAQLRDQLNERMRIIQLELRKLTTIVQQTHQTQLTTHKLSTAHMQETILLNQSVTAAHIHIRHQLSDIQLAQALTAIASACKVDHKATYEQARVLCRNRNFAGRAKCAPFWTSPKLHSWDRASLSLALTLKATYRDRSSMRDFCINVIDQLSSSNVAVLWIFKPRDGFHSEFDVLKSLIYQALSMDYVSRDDAIFSFQLRQFQGVHRIEDYVSLLSCILEYFPLVYIVIDTSALSDEDAAHIRRLLKDIMHEFKRRELKTVIKILFVQCRPGGASEEGDNEILLKVARTAQRKGKKIPARPLRTGQKQLQNSRTLVIRP